MRETLWDLRQIRERREKMAREMEEVRLAKSLRSKKGRSLGLVVALLGEATPGAVRLTKALRGSKEPEGRERGPSPT